MITLLVWEAAARKLIRLRLEEDRFRVGDSMVSFFPPFFSFLYESCDVRVDADGGCSRESGRAAGHVFAKYWGRFVVAVTRAWIRGASD